MGEKKEVMEQGASVVVRWKADEGWPIQFMSKGISLFGYSPQDFVKGKMTWNDITLSEDIPRLKKEVAEHLRLESDEFDQEYRIRTKDGGIRWVLDKTIAVKESGKVTHLHSVIVDITQIKEREETIKRYMEGLEETRKSLSKANRILFLQSKVVDCLCGYSDALSIQDLLKLICRDLKLNSLFVYACQKQAEQLAGWTQPNGEGEWSLPKSVELETESLLALRAWITKKGFSFESMSCLPDELRFMSCDAAMRNVTNVAVVSVQMADKPWGIVCFGTHNGKTWANDELEALLALGKMLALVAQNRRNQEVLEREIGSRIVQIQEVMEQINKVSYARNT